MIPVRVSFWYEFIPVLIYRSVFVLYWYEIFHRYHVNKYKAISKNRDELVPEWYSYQYHVNTPWVAMRSIVTTHLTMTFWDRFVGQRYRGGMQRNRTVSFAFRSSLGIFRPLCCLLGCKLKRNDLFHGNLISFAVCHWPLSSCKAVTCENLFPCN